MKTSNCGDRGRVGCGALIQLVPVIPDVPTKGSTRSWIPLDVAYDPACGFAPSHALSAGRKTCRPLARGEQPAPGEHPAITHFATCPLRRAQNDMNSTTSED
ncbi:MAG: hypothetical protein FWF90_11525 [Promicromonosporaceae bacterium]|nr:hypothetical protein [Promicromonosporaceae bacterium]